MNRFIAIGSKRRRRPAGKVLLFGALAGGFVEAAIFEDMRLVLSWPAALGVFVGVGLAYVILTMSLAYVDGMDATTAQSVSDDLRATTLSKDLLNLFTPSKATQMNLWNDSESRSSTPPFIVVELGVLAAVFDDLQSAEHHFEAYDADILLAFDSRGRRFKVLPVPNDSVCIVPEEPECIDQDGLRQVLVDILQKVESVIDPHAPLAVLIEQARVHFLYQGPPSIRAWARGAIRKLRRRTGE